MNANQVWESFFGDASGTAFRSALMLLLTIPPERFDESLSRISRETTIGPMTNPTAYLDGKRFDNARDYSRLIEAGAKVRSLLAEVMAKGGRS